MLINKIDMNASSMNGKDMIMPMFTVKVPVYRKKYNASVKEAELMEKSANEQLNNTENMLFMEYSDYRFALNDAERKQNLYKELISLTQRDFDLLLTQYATAGIDMESLIRIHRQLLDYKLNISQAQVDELTAIAGIRKLLSNN
ncbi:MAG: TolC family protein [Bacteroidota bacterium]|nr:TolC family protein [Bacteroidota bacterium]